MNDINERIVAATVWGDTYQLRADWADAASDIEFDREDHWHPTGYQVADFGHSPVAALRQHLEEIARDGGDDPADYADEIADAIEAG